MFKVLLINVAAPELPVVVKVIAPCLLLKVVQSVEDRAPLLAALAVGTCSVMTGVVVPFTTLLDRSVPVVPIVRAATLVTVPPEDGAELVIIPVALS